MSVEIQKSTRDTFFYLKAHFVSRTMLSVYSADLSQNRKTHSHNRMAFKNSDLVPRIKKKIQSAFLTYKKVKKWRRDLIGLVE